MTLQITEKDTVFYLKGSLNTKTSNFFNVYFESLLEQFKKVVINIDDIAAIDKIGVATFKNLFYAYKQQKKQLLIIGNGCKDLYDAF